MSDPTEWMLNNAVSEFLLMPGGVLFMCLMGYTFLHGCKVFNGFPKSNTNNNKNEDCSVAYKFVSMILACTGGGIMVPIFLNGIPVPLANDSYPMAILISFTLHHYFPILREVVALSKIFKVCLVILYETTRAGVVVKLTSLAAIKISPSIFQIPLFGPIFCGTIGGCGGAFLPYNKGLDPIKGGLASPMQTAFIGATCFHLYVNTSLSDECIQAKLKAHIYLALFFISVGIVNVFELTASKTVNIKPKKEE